MQASRLIALEFDDTSGKFVSFSLESLKDETAGFTKPLAGMPDKWREHWQIVRKRALAEGEPAEVAWYQASAAVADVEAKFRQKARKRFFRG